MLPRIGEESCMKWKKPKGRERRWNKKELLRRDGNLCALCKEPMLTMKDITIDHIQPVSKGGTDDIKNLQLAHPHCNQKRGAA